MIKKIHIIALLFTLLGLRLSAQDFSDLCLGAIVLDDVDSWCSSNGAFNNFGATESVDEALPTCWPSIGADVWFRFTAVGNSVSVGVVGQTTAAPGGSLDFPQLAIYEGFCGSLTQLACSSDAINANIVELQIQNLIPGQEYFLRVSGRNMEEGSFKLCVNNFNRVPDPSGDCVSGVILCDKSSFTVPSVLGEGSNPNEMDGECLGGEFSSSWYKWTCEQSGSLTFVLSPLVATDDLDFAIYEMPNGIENCSDMELLRCMASGENVGQPFPQWEICVGETGLDNASTDDFEAPGCQNGSDNFVRALDMEAGKSYALIINNFTNNGNGYSLSFGGSGTFVGPQPAFSILPDVDVSCDIDTVFFEETATLPPGSSATYSWYFGQGANPATATGPGPHQVVYTSFGNKSVLLEVETDNGCIVTDVSEVFIKSCCDPSIGVSINLDDYGDPECANTNSGFLNVSGAGGTPFYQYSIDGVNFQPLGMFIGLASGQQTVYIQDTKGCVDSLEQILVNPPPIIVDAGSDQDITLGETAFLNGTVIAPNPLVTSYNWYLSDPPLSCLDCLDPDVIPFEDTFYYLEASDDIGCTFIDSVLVRVDKVRPVYIPNVFSPNFDGINDYFTLYGGAAGRYIKTLSIYDRWGGEVFRGEKLPLNAESAGWDGRVNGQRANAGVYAFFAEVEFIDGIVLLYEGSITLMR